MGRTLAAGTAVMFFVIALVAFAANGDRIAAFAALAGLTTMSIAVLLHVSDPGHR
jgi:hypothetical protein